MKGEDKHLQRVQIERMHLIILYFAVKIDHLHNSKDDSIGRISLVELFKYLVLAQLQLYYPNSFSDTKPFSHLGLF